MSYQSEKGFDKLIAGLPDNYLGEEVVSETKLMKLVRKRSVEKTTKSNLLEEKKHA